MEEVHKCSNTLNTHYAHERKILAIIEQARYVAKYHLSIDTFTAQKVLYNPL